MSKRSATTRRRVICYAVIDIKYNLEKEPPLLKRIETKDALARELDQLEKIGTVASVTVYLNHHKHKLVSTWTDELYKEPTTDAAPNP